MPALMQAYADALKQAGWSFVVGHSTLGWTARAWRETPDLDFVETICPRCGTRNVEPPPSRRTTSASGVDMEAALGNLVEKVLVGADHSCVR